MFGLGVYVRGGAAKATFTPEQLLTSDTTFATNSGWTLTGTGISITGGQLVNNGTVTLLCQALAGNYTRVPVAGEKVFLEFDVVSYTEGNIGPRIRFTDGSLIYFFGDQAGNGPLAGGSAAAGHKVSPHILLPVGKTFDRVEMRSTVRNGSVNWVCDNLQLWTKE